MVSSTPVNGIFAVGHNLRMVNHEQYIVVEKNELASAVNQRSMQILFHIRAKRQFG